MNNTCTIKNNCIQWGNEVIFENLEAETFSDFAKSYYRHLELKYPKFHKMDNLSKLGFLAFETLLKKENIDFDLEKLAIIFANSSSSLDTDENYYETLSQEGSLPSPSLFVYTLPNIVIGEICIRHKIKGEHAFFVFDEFDEKFVTDYAQTLLANPEIPACAIGWVELKGAQYEAKMTLIKRTKNISNG